MTTIITPTQTVPGFAPAAAPLSLFGLSLFNGSQDQAIAALLEAPHPITAAFLNAHCVNMAHRDEGYLRALQQADVLLPDGSGIAIAAKLSGQQMIENLNGTDLFAPLCQAAARKGQSIFFFGGQPGVAAKAARNAKDNTPGLVIAGTAHGFFSPEEEDDLIDMINRSGADILLVGLGVPLQDRWIRKNRARLRPHVAIGVGAQFDFHSGRVSRAPKLLRKTGMEWVWRLMIEPKRMFTRYVIGNPLFLSRAVAHAAAYAARQFDSTEAIKRALDVTLSGAALAMLSPFFFAMILAIKLDSPGPAFFTQTRVGKNGRHFRVFKFRSMYRDAEARRAALLAQSDRDGVCFKVREDPRVTRIGRLLRRTSLDELPQIINVLIGDMSIVGPRPGLPEEVAAYPTRAMERLAVRPGITGIWQVSGRADIGFDKMIDMDVAYVRSRSILLDVMLVLLTFRAVISGRGAY